MSLSLQFLSLVISFTYGLIMAFIYSLVNRLFFVLRHTLIRYLVEMVMMAMFSFLYVMVNVYINDGQINLYMILCLILGLMSYERYYAIYCLYYMEYIMKGINYIFRPVVFIFKKICAIFNRIGKKVGQWHKKEKHIEN